MVTDGRACKECVYADEYALLCEKHEGPIPDAESGRASEASVRYLERRRDEGGDRGSE